MDMVKLLGSIAMSKTPAKASIIPKPRRHPTVSPKKAMLIKVAKGTPNCATTETEDASAFARPKNSSAKCPDPMKKEIRNKVFKFLGNGRRKGTSKIATPKNRIAAKKIGGTAASNTTQRVTTIFNPQTKQHRKRRLKSRKPIQ